MSAVRDAEWSVVLTVVIVWATIQAGAERAFPDDPIQITFFNGPLPSTVNVRLEEFKTKSGVTFRRKTVAANFIACLEEYSSEDLSATSFLKCAQETEDAGLYMFKFEGDVCTGYSAWLPQEHQRCVGSGTVVVYTVLDATYEGDRTTLDGVETITSSYLTFGPVELCANYTITVAPLHANDEDIGTQLETTVATASSEALWVDLTRKDAPQTWADKFIEAYRQHQLK